jgi:hypothetical protein
LVNSLKTAFCFLIVAGQLCAVQVGDTRESVIGEKGQPTGEMKGGSVEVLRYADVTIRLRDGLVIAVEKASARATSEPKAIVQSPVVDATHSVATPDLSEPPFPRGFVGFPEFQTTVGMQSAGTAFLARITGDSQVYILSVHHLLGPDGGFRTLLTHEQVPSFVRGIRIAELFGQSTPYKVKGCFIPSAGNLDDPRYELLAFKTNGVATILAPELAATLPGAGEPVWIIAHVRGGVPKGELIHRAHVIPDKSPWLWAQFDNPNIITNGASGAPVLNAAGQIVGIYRGHQDDNGRKFAMIIPSPLIIETLRGL